MKYLREKKSDPQNTHEKKSLDHEIPTTKKFGLQNNHEKKFWTHEIPTKARWHNGTVTHEILRRPTETHDGVPSTKFNTLIK